MDAQMNYQEKEKYARLCEIFEDNYAITRMYAWYLENCPELINAEMICELTADGAMTRAEGCAAIVAEVLGLDAARSARDRRLIRDYVNRSVRVLDPSRYTENPYYKNIRIENVRSGDWEFKKEVYPAYRAMICGDMIMDDDWLEVPPLGFFSEDFAFPAVLEGGNEWMTLTPVDLDTSEDAIARAHGRVVTFGLGLGYYAYMVSEKTEVESITVIERSERVIELFKEHILPQFPSREKVRVILADAIEYAEREMPREHYDVAFVDIWRDASDGAPIYRKMKHVEQLCPDTEFLWWIENFLISRCRAEEYAAIAEELEEGSDLTYYEIEERLRRPLG